MRLLINKKKIYFYLVSLILLSSIFNINIISNYENLIKVKDIEIVGLNSKEQKNIKNELGFLKNKNIFLIKKNDLKEILNDFNFINYFIINKILPSKIELFIKKTNLIGVTYKNQNKFYIGENGKLIAESDLENTENLAALGESAQRVKFSKTQPLTKNHMNDVVLKCHQEYSML